MDVVSYELMKSETLKSDVSLLQSIVDYVGDGRGKQIRPMLTFAVAEALGEVGKSAYTGALLIELLHTASLIHDDVVDESDKRRGRASVNKIWDNKAAILSGDYLFAKCLRIASDSGDIRYINEFAWCSEMITQGELLQLEKSKSLDITEEDYFRIISMKTSSLFVAAAYFGAMMADDETIRRMRRFGDIFGQLFQIRDDILDMDTSGISGKPYGVDIKEKKITLPLIYAIRKASESDRSEIMTLLNKGEVLDNDVVRIIEIAKDLGCERYAEGVIDRLLMEGVELITSKELPLTVAGKNRLKELLYMAAKRDK